MQPRNLLKIFNHCRGFATNFNRQTIQDIDIEKGLKAYSSDLLEELDTELTRVFPGAHDLLYHFMDTQRFLTIEELNALLVSANVDASDHDKVLSFLLYYGVLVVQIGEAEYFMETTTFKFCACVQTDVR